MPNRHDHPSLDHLVGRWRVRATTVSTQSSSVGVTNTVIADGRLPALPGSAFDWCSRKR